MFVRFRSILVVGGFYSMTLASHASTLTTCYANSTPQQSSPSLAQCVGNTTIPNVGVQDASSTGRASYGTLGVSGQLETINQSSAGIGADYNATASFTDTFTVTTSFPTSGNLVFTDVVDGTSSYSGTGSYGAGATNGLFDDTDIYVNSLLGSYGLGADYYLFPGTGTTLETFVIPFNSSQLETFTITLTTDGECGSTGVGSSCNVSSNYLNTSTITGYSLEDLQGNPISGAVTFGSGTNYDAIPSDTVVTPEPSTIILVVSGISSLMGITRARRAPLRQ